MMQKNGDIGTFDNFIIECGIYPVPNKHRIITNLTSANVYEHVEDFADLQSVIDNLEKPFVKSECDFCPPSPLNSASTVWRNTRSVSPCSSYAQ